MSDVPLLVVNNVNEILHSTRTYKKMWMYGCQKIIDKRKAEGKKAIFNCAKDMYEWWLSGNSLSTAEPDNINLFGLLIDEWST